MTRIVETLQHLWTRFVRRDEAKWSELVEWSFRPDSELTMENPEWVDFCKRYERSRIKVWMEPYTRPAPKVAEERK